MDNWHDWLFPILAVVLFLIGNRARREDENRSSSDGRSRSVMCNHDWGIADAETGWDQKCRKCGAWKSGYGKTWR